MKITNRIDNKFEGISTHEYDEIEYDKAPWYLKLTFFMLFIGFIVGLAIAIVTDYFVLSILGTLMYFALMISIFGLQFDIAKYGKLQTSKKYYAFGGIAIAAIIFLSIILIVMFGGFVAISIILVVVFLTVGIVLISIKSKANKQKAKCTVEVWAICDHIEGDSHWINMLNNDDMPPSFNEKIARANVVRPVFIFEYQGNRYEVKKNYYTGHTDVEVGKQYRLRIDPSNPENFFQV